MKHIGNKYFRRQPWIRQQNGRSRRQFHFRLKIGSREFPYAKM